MEEKIIDKIRKLIKKSESARELGSIEEAEAFAQKAQQMLQQHNLTKEHLTEKQAADEIIDVTMPSKVPGIGGRSSYWVMDAIAKFNWCKAYTYGKASSNKMIIIGSPENIEVCKYIHSVVMVAFMNAGKKKYKEHKEFYLSMDETPVGLDTYMRTFLKGCADGLRDKLSAESEKFKKSSNQANAIIRTNQIVVQNYVVAKWGGEGKGRQAKFSNKAGDAYSQGKEIGKNVTITKGVETTSKPIVRKMLS